ncbi:MAG: hypothetical protein JRI57_03885 [Deltaproteobacteria bacterium]|nr:hypothetical protein [Deltaproteobacteria bacterium]MBW1951707.1 hypothetical protein [Deltaproteobacteria bacterium]MBW2134720.1 hypothetical protein [Deltaproteobacteria bacterium]
MELHIVDLMLGLGTGLILGVGLTLAGIKIKGLFKGSEVKRLREENRHLKRRIEEKDRHIGRMLTETEKLVQGLAKVKIPVPPQVE